MSDERDREQVFLIKNIRFWIIPILLKTWLLFGLTRGFEYSSLPNTNFDNRDHFNQVEFDKINLFKRKFK